MDGNGRWAQQLGRPRVFGHIKGTRNAKKIITECSRRGIEYLTLYAFSLENWLRPDEEVQFLMRLLKKYLHRETDNLIKENIQFSVVGETWRLPEDVRIAVEESRERTSKCTGLKLIFALSYGSKQEISHAVQKITHDVFDRKITPDQVSPQLIESYLWTHGNPDPDLIIRTSGEFRISNFMLWQAAYSELYFSNVLWPDFSVEDLNQALGNFSRRDRRFGKLSDEQLRH